jgi:hypothetical protein
MWSGAEARDWGRVDAGRAAGELLMLLLPVVVMFVDPDVERCGELPCRRFELCDALSNMNSTHTRKQGDKSHGSNVRSAEKKKKKRHVRVGGSVLGSSDVRHTYK